MARKKNDDDKAAKERKKPYKPSFELKSTKAENRRKTPDEVKSSRKHLPKQREKLSVAERKHLYAVCLVDHWGNHRAALRAAGATNKEFSEWLKHDPEFADSIKSEMVVLYSRLIGEKVERAFDKSLGVRSDKHLDGLLEAIDPTVWDSRVRAQIEENKGMLMDTVMRENLTQREFENAQKLDPASDSYEAEFKVIEDESKAD